LFFVGKRERLPVNRFLSSVVLQIAECALFTFDPNLKECAMAHIISTPKGTIEYSDNGKGTPILFFHGGHSNCDELLFQQGYDLTQFRLIVPSRPGYGKTTLTGNESPKQAAELMLLLLDTLQLETVVVAGISAGGLTAIEFAARFPERVEKLMLISAITKRWLTPENALYKKGKKIFRPSREKFMWGMFRFMYRLFPRMMSEMLFKELSTVRPSEITERDIAGLGKMVLHQRSYNGFTNDLDQQPSGDIVHRISCPTLILHSLNDASVNLIHPMHAGEAIRNAKVITYRNAWGHLLWMGEGSEDPIRDAMTFLGAEEHVEEAHWESDQHVLIA